MHIKLCFRLGGAKFSKFQHNYKRETSIQNCGSSQALAYFTKMAVNTNSICIQIFDSNVCKFQREFKNGLCTRNCFKFGFANSSKISL